MVTDADGTYAVTNLGPGAYTVQAELSGFATQAREIVLGVGQVETLDITLGVAGLQEAVTVSASAQVIDISSARIGVNVSPEELDNLPVNGRNFANLMTLATGATSDGNGGWASVRFNGKSNQQNYLNYDGVDGTYVWDASPGYLNATGLAVPPADVDGVGLGVPRQLGPRPGRERSRRRRQHHRDQRRAAATPTVVPSSNTSATTRWMRPASTTTRSRSSRSTSSAAPSADRWRATGPSSSSASRGCGRRPGSASPRPCRAPRRGAAFSPASRSAPALGRARSVRARWRRC